jgi:hypothetical protein
MLRTKKEESAEELALKLYEQDREAAQQKQAEEAAFAEIEVPVEYLQKARTQIAAKKAGNKNQIVIAILIAFAIALAVTSLMLIGQPPAPAPPVVIPKQTAWLLETSPGAEATTTIDSQGFTELQVIKFGNEERYFATLRYPSDPIETRGLSKVVIKARGTLPKFRLRLMQGTDSYLTPPMALNPATKQYEFPLSQLQHTRPSNGGNTDLGFGKPNRIDVLQVQTGVYVNPRDASGTLTIESINVN